ncbi:MAG TPA: DUF971 domain-containing protein [Actinobacteria bacterium]|nr:DUF971 domain-containing protein [Actinomycetota bacterium]
MAIGNEPDFVSGDSTGEVDEPRRGPRAQGSIPGQVQEVRMTRTNCEVGHGRTLVLRQTTSAAFCRSGTPRRHRSTRWCRLDPKGPGECASIVAFSAATHRSGGRLRCAALRAMRLGIDRTNASCQGTIRSLGVLLVGPPILGCMELPITIELERGERLTLIWEDGERTELTAAPLRRACPCAVCEGTAAGWPIRSVTIANIEESGAYGLRLVFAPDGHQAGIYDYDYLRALGRRDEDAL